MASGRSLGVCTLSVVDKPSFENPSRRMGGGVFVVMRVLPYSCRFLFLFGLWFFSLGYILRWCTSSPWPASLSSRLLLGLGITWRGSLPLLLLSLTIAIIQYVFSLDLKTVLLFPASGRRSMSTVHGTDVSGRIDP